MQEATAPGDIEVMGQAAGYVVKRLVVSPGGRLSPQRHQSLSEHWVVVSGMARVTRGPHAFTMQANEAVFIPAGMRHGLENLSDSEPLEIIGVQIGRDDAGRLSAAPNNAG